MAIINCPECGKEISEDAKICPNCGKPFTIKTNTRIIIIVCCFIGLFVVGLLYYNIIYKNSPNYIVKQYVKALKNYDYKTIKKYTYNYDKYEVYVHENICEEHEYTGFTKGKKFNDLNFIIDYYNSLYNVEIDCRNIEYVIGYSIDTTEEQSESIFLGKISGKWKVVFSTLTGLYQS